MEIPGNADLRYTGTRKREYLKGGTTNEESLDFVRQSPQGRQLRPAGSEFMRGAQESGNEVQKIFVRSKKIVPCNACYYCRDHGGKCALNDDMSEILDAMQAADVIVMASPVYFYSIDAQMKIIIDRSLARWTNIPNKEFYFIMTCADDNRAAMACTLECFRGFTACLNGAKEKGVIYGTGVYRPGEVMSSPAMKEAYEMGKNV